MQLDSTTAFRNQSLVFYEDNEVVDSGTEIPGEPTEYGPVDCRVRDVTSQVQRGPGGAAIQWAFKLYTADRTTTIKVKHRVPIVTDTDTVWCEVAAVRKYKYTRQIDVEKKTGKSLR